MVLNFNLNISSRKSLGAYILLFQLFILKDIS
ncbi:hypothetical protein T4C_9656 [Trichinella pseudospiralis]|uniref:Uncharacterized protein n=1 Tax=Trichinella pseudospiralis TaxID=6337 RepID=A0A0V1GFL6_TRIPS|nr:hypothetical protein T4C_8284 [Trichinella pseudospiralis]KRY97031.1 hypothetical protein T4C_9656 [Trichinella pseudospiralis]